MTRRKANNTLSRTSSPTALMPPLLIVSLGNPAPYTNTLHSAGHILLLSLARFFSAPLPTRDRTYPAGLVSHSSTTDSPVLLFQSTAYMNESGPGTAGAWRTFSSQHSRDAPQLIVMHDELELPLGRFAVKRGAGRSARGHNGLKSLLAQHGMRQVDFLRVGVGIGPRPVSREPDVVAKFVLGKLVGADREKVEELAVPVWKALEHEIGA